MKKIVLLLVFVALVAIVFAEGIEINSPMGTFKMSVNSSSSSKKVAVVDEISNKLEILNKKYCSQLNKLKQRKASKLIDEIYDLLAMLPEDVYVTQTTSSSTSSSSASSNQNANININVNTPETVTSHKEVVVQETEVTSSPAMSENAFQTLYNNVKDESFADDKLSVIKVAAKRNGFKVSQLTRLLDLFSFADDKVACVNAVYPKIVDKKNAHQILNHFTFSGDKKKVEAIINQ